MINSIQNVLIGIDLDNNYSQISYYNKKDRLPVTLTTVAGTDKFQIPTAIFKKHNSDKWYYGREAIYFAKRGEGTLVDNLLKKCESKKTTLIEGEQYEAYELLSIFFELMIGLLSPFHKPENIGGVMVTCEEQTPAYLENIPKALQKFGVPENRIYIQTHLESFYYYALSQKKELWTYDVALFEYKKDTVIGSILHLNRRVSPIVVSITEMGKISLKEKYGKRLTDAEWNRKKDQMFLGLIEKVLGTRPVSCAYLIGTGFDKSWADKSIAYLCNRRRVFQGGNLYTKGACYGARERSDEKELKNYLYESKDMIRCNIGMEMHVKGKQTYVTFVQAGINWYEAHFNCEFILENENNVVLLLHSLIHGEKKEFSIPLTDLPNRPPKSTRLLLDLRFVSREVCKIEITDLGFGELYPSSNKIWKSTIEF